MLYAEIRRLHSRAPTAVWRAFRKRRDDLFLHHPQTPLNAEQRARFTGLAYFPYDPEWCVLGRGDTAVSPHTYHVTLPADGDFTFTRCARLHKAKAVFILKPQCPFFR